MNADPDNQSPAFLKKVSRASITTPVTVLPFSFEYFSARSNKSRRQVDRYLFGYYLGKK
jgi:hypothetical protein